MGVHVDQSGHDDVVQLVDHRVRRVLSLHLLGNECCGNADHLGGQAVDNLLSIDDDGVEVIDRVLGNDGNNPSRVDNQTHRSHARSASLLWERSKRRKVKLANRLSNVRSVHALLEQTIW